MSRVVWYSYKKPGAWLWTPRTTKSLTDDIESGFIQRDWRFRLEGDSREYSLDELSAIDAAQSAKASYEAAIVAYQSEPLPASPDYAASSSGLGTLLSRYLSRYVGVNHRDPKKFERVLLTLVTDEFFSVLIPDTKTTISFPLRYILRVTEAETAVSGGIFQEKFPVIIQVFHLVIYSGAVGISFPL
jgi:hypothetical protein